MNSVNVTFDLPQHIWEGLKNGTMERVGGVIRRTDGTKRILAWLQEGGGAAMEHMPEATMQISKVLANQSLMLGMQAANLAVSAVGFAVMYYKLDKIEKQLLGLGGKLDKLRHDFQWLDTKQLISTLAPVMAAIKKVSRAEKIANRDVLTQSLIHADADLGVAGEYFRELLGRMMTEQLEVDRPYEFAACYRAWVMSAQGGSAAMTALQEMSEAQHRIDQFKHEHAQFGRDYMVRRSDPMARIKSGGKSLASDIALNTLGREMAGVHDIVKGQSLQLEFIDRKGLDLRELNARINMREATYVCYSIAP